MKLKKIEPGNYWMNDMFPSSLNSLVKEFFDNDVKEVFPNKASFRPRTDISETADNFTLELALPGIKRDEVKIELNNGILEISGERKNQKVEDTDKYHLSEITYGKFTRRFTLPDNVETDKIDAKVEDGILSLSIPKSAERKARLIDVK